MADGNVETNSTPSIELDVRGWNMMASFRSRLSDPRYGLMQAGKPEKVKFDFVMLVPALREQTDVGAPAECAFQSDGFPLAQRPGDPAKQHALAFGASALGSSGERPRAILSALRNQRQWSS
jgi:hypothetical protein